MINHPFETFKHTVKYDTFTGHSLESGLSYSYISNIYTYTHTVYVFRIDMQTLGTLEN